MAKENMITVADVVKKIKEIDAYKSYMKSISDFFSEGLTQADSQKVSEIHSYIHKFVDIPYDIKSVFVSIIRLLSEEQDRLQRLIDRTTIDM